MSKIYNLKNVNDNGDAMSIYSEGWVTMVYIGNKLIGSISAYMKTADECKEELIHIMEPHVSEKFLRLVSIGLFFKPSVKDTQG